MSSSLLDNKEEGKMKESEGDGSCDTYAKYREIASTLPKKKGMSHAYLHRYQGYWFRSGLVENIMWLQKHFKARPDDVLLVTTPKSGTTWLKALTFSIVNRTKFELCTHPLLQNNPHVCVPFLEFGPRLSDPVVDPELINSPRLLSTHIPYELLLQSMMTSSIHGKIIYMCRDPRDAFISRWHFTNKRIEEGMPQMSLNEAFGLFIEGLSTFGPDLDHVLGYWRASCEFPNQIMFIKYEDLQGNTNDYVRKIAQFLGCPFTPQEEETGMVKQVVDLCSFDYLKNLEVNKNGSYKGHITNAYFFRQGKIGDWKNYFTPKMIETFDRVIEDKITSKRSLRF